MPTPKQVPIQFTPDQLHRLRSLSTESGRSIAALVRDAVDRMLAPEAGIPASAFWLILRDPQHWQTFKQIAAEMEALAAANQPAPPLADTPPTWRHQRGGAGPRIRPPPPPEPPMEDPFK